MPTNETLPAPAEIQGVIDSNDLSNGHYLANFRKLSLNDPTAVKRWDAIMKWLATLGCPTASCQFFSTPYAGGGYTPTEARFTREDDGQLLTLRLDAVMTFNFPNSAVLSFHQAFGGSIPTFAEYPGTEQFLQHQGVSPIGAPLPEFNTPGWSQPFARYYALGDGYEKGKTLDPYKDAAGVTYQIRGISAGAATGPFSGTPTKIVWERTTV